MSKIFALNNQRVTNKIWCLQAKIMKQNELDCLWKMLLSLLNSCVNDVRRNNDNSWLIKLNVRSLSSKVNENKSKNGLAEPTIIDNNVIFDKIIFLINHSNYFNDLSRLQDNFFLSEQHQIVSVKFKHITGWLICQ